MKPDPLEDLLQAYAKHPLPPPTSHTKAAIWREIGERKHQGGWLGFGAIRSWHDLFARPRIAVAGLAVALLTGMLPVAAATMAQDAPRKIRDSLHLDYFTCSSTCMCCNPPAEAGHR